MSSLQIYNLCSFQAKVLDSSIEFVTKREVTSPDKSKFITNLEVKPGGKYELVADTTHHFERGNIDFQVDAVIKVHGQPNDYKYVQLVVVCKNIKRFIVQEY
jgi:hypothetical protein